MSEAPAPKVPLTIWTDPRFQSHQSSGYHPERPARLDAALRGARAVVAEARGAERAVAHPATREALERVHSAAHLDRLDAAAAKGARVQLDPDTYFGPGSLEAATLAAGGAVAMVDAIVGGGVDLGMLLARPPGHHAMRDRAMGFCLLNNVAVAAAHARALGARRVAIVDWDVHHGNGTQDIFSRDPTVLFVSLHQAPLYPDSGWVGEVGEGDGAGFTLNLPFPAAGDGALYAAAFARVVLPVLDEYRPDLILVSAGYDGHARDPLASMLLRDGDYAWMAARLREAAGRLCGGRIGFCLEGGYDLGALEEGVAATLRGALDPAAHPTPSSEAPPPAAERIIDGVVRAAAPWWRCLRDDPSGRAVSAA
ncbi:MAG: Acetylspermidine deacetylase [Myxococcaceae bacterium]|nr:Acetylspermidine deacetylase [Myxococcaceae bacterium]